VQYNIGNDEVDLIAQRAVISKAEDRQGRRSLQLARGALAFSVKIPTSVRGRSPRCSDRGEVFPKIYLNNCGANLAQPASGVDAALADTSVACMKTSL
jgi:hypothetical protein